MGSLRITLCTGVLAACALTPPVYAVDGGGAGVSVTPSSPAPGADVALRVTGCSARTATAVSMAFAADAHLAGADGTLAGDTKVRASAGPGSYDVQITCAGLVINSRITVVAQSAQTGQSAQTEQSEEADQAGEAEQADQPSQPEQQPQSPSKPQARTDPQADSHPQPDPHPSASRTDAALPVTLASPVAPARAGGGATAHVAPVDAHAAAPGIVHAITGLLLAGIAAAAVAVLRASRSRRTG